VADSFFNIFHFGPCFEEDDSLTVYASVFDSYKFGGEMGFDADTQQFDPIAWSNGVGAPAPRLDKFVLDLKRGVVNGRDRIPLLDTNSGMDVPVDMPTFNGDGNVCRYSYFVGGARPEGWFPFRSVVKADLQAKQMWNWDAGDDRIVSEPMFVPRTDSTAEDDGFVLSIVHSASDENCVLMVWDSQLFDEGPIASVDLGELMPWCVHGSWNPGFVAD
jgi:carotenoid cleavage dioxygenase-like enzyme